MAVTVEALELNVKSSADSAATSVQALIEKLRTLKTELGANFNTNFGEGITKAASSAIKSIKTEFAKGMTDVGRTMRTGMESVTKKQVREMAKSLQKSYGIRGRDLSVDTIAKNLQEVFNGANPSKGLKGFSGTSLNTLKSLSESLTAHGHPSTGGDLIDIMRQHMPQIRLTKNDLSELKYAGMSVKDARAMLSPMGISVSKDKGMRIEDALTTMYGSHGVDPVSAQLRAALGSDTKNIGIMEVMSKLQSAWDARNNGMVSQMTGNSGLTAPQVAARDIASQVLEMLKATDETVTNARAEVQRAAKTATQSFMEKHADWYAEGAAMREANRNPDVWAVTSKQYGDGNAAPEMVNNSVLEATDEAIEATENFGRASSSAANEARESANEAKEAQMSYAEAVRMTKEELLQMKIVAAGDKVSAAVDTGDPGKIASAVAAYQKAQDTLMQYRNEVKMAAQDEAEFQNLLSRLNADGAADGVKRLAVEKHNAGTSAKALTNSLYDLDGELKAKKKDTVEAAGGFQTFRKAVQDGHSSVKQYIKNHTKLLQQFGRVAKMRAMRYAIRMITQGLKEGITNLYEYSKATKGSFATSMDTISSTMLTLKNSIATAIAPLIQQLVPVLQQVVGWIREACNWLAQFFATMNGQSTWTRAKDSVIEWGDQTKKATKNASDGIKEALASFDELNVIAKESSNGSGSGSSTATAVKDMFEEVPITSKSAKGWGEALKEPFQWVLDNVGAVAAGIAGWKLILKPIIKDIINAKRIVTPPTTTPTTTPTSAPNAPLTKWDKVVPTIDTKIKNTYKLLGASSGSAVDLSTNLAAVSDWFTNETAVGRQVTNWINSGLQSILGEGTGIYDWLHNDSFGKIIHSGFKFFGLNLSDAKPQFADEDVFSGVKQISENAKSFWYDWDTTFMALGLKKDDGRLSGESRITEIGSEAEKWYEYAEAINKANVELIDLTESYDTVQRLLNDKEFVAPVISSVGFEKSADAIIESARIFGDETETVIEHWDLIAPLVDDTNYAKTLAQIKGTAQSTGVDTVTIMKNWKFIAPTIEKQGFEESMTGIEYIAWWTGVDTKTIIDHWEFIAPDIDKYGFEETAFWISDIASATGKKTEDIIDAWKFISPGLEYHDFEKTSLMLGAFAKTEGIDISEIIREWEFIAPYIDDSRPLESAYEIAKLIVDSGENWKEELKKTKLEAPNVTTSSNFWTNVSNTIKTMITSQQNTLNKTPLQVNTKVQTPAVSVLSGVLSVVKSFFNSNPVDIKVGADMSQAASDIANWKPFGSNSTKKTLNSFFPGAATTVTNTATGTTKTAQQIYYDWLDETITDDGFTQLPEWEDEVRKMLLGYAGGGFPHSGSLFLAHENGSPELVGQFGSHTAVANNEQIVSGIARGMSQVMRGVEERLDRIERNTGISAEKDPTVRITPSAALGRVNAQSAALYGATSGGR